MSPIEKKKNVPSHILRHRADMLQRHDLLNKNLKQRKSQRSFLFKTQLKGNKEKQKKGGIELHIDISPS